jgi:hypothetical protein
MNYPEGWATKGTGIEELIQDKNNLVRILVEPGSPTMSQVQQDVAKLKTSAAGITVSAPIPHPTCTNMGKTVNLPLAVAEVNYTTQSKADPVTGKQVTLLVDRYYTKDGSKLAVIDMGTPKGVDNVDAYCLMISSFR